MEQDENYVCRRRKVGDVYEIECGKEGENEAQPKKMHCVFTTKGRTGGASGLSFGGQYGENNPVLECFSEDEFKKQMARQLKTKEKNIEIVDEEQ